MIARSVVFSLLLAAAVLLVAFAVLMGGFGLAAAAQDRAAAQALWWIAMGLLMLLAVDFILLIGVLALRELDRHDEP